jgi:hypothetical protein
MSKITEGFAVSTEPRSIATGEKIPNLAIFLRRTLLEFLQILFAQRDKGSFHYDPDNTATELQICDLHAVDLDAISVRPAIIAVRGPLGWQDAGGLGGSAVEGRNMRSGDTTFSTLLTGSVAFSCISREGVEAEQLGHIVFNSLKFFRPVLQQYGLFTIKSLNIGAESLIETEGANDKTTLVPVYVTALVQDRWVLSDTAARKLQQIVIETLFNVR